MGKISGIDGLSFVATGDLEHFGDYDPVFFNVGNDFYTKDLSDLKEYIRIRGGFLRSAVSSKTDYLICNDPNSTTVKSRKAKELNIPVITEQEFLAMAAEGFVEKETAAKDFLLDCDTDGLLVREGVLIKCESKEKDIVVPEGVTHIGRAAFSLLKNLRSVTLPAGLKNIGDSAFYGCRSLETVVLPDSVTEIEAHAFSECGRLTSIVIPSAVTHIGKEAFKDCEALKSAEIRGSVKVIPESLFYGCRKLMSVTLPEGARTIDAQAFCYCDALTSIVIPDSVTTIKTSVFSQCDNLSSVKLSAKLKSIPPDAFFGCTKLTDIVLPNFIKKVGERAFYYCDHLQRVTLPQGISTIASNAFAESQRLEEFVLPNDAGVADVLWQSMKRGALKMVALESILKYAFEAIRGTALEQIFRNRKKEFMEYCIVRQKSAELPERMLSLFSFVSGKELDDYIEMASAHGAIEIVAFLMEKRRSVTSGTSFTL